MKNTSYIVSYIFTLIVGVLLLIYWNAVNIFQIIIIAIGCCFILPSLIGLFLGFSGKKNPDGTRSSRPWYVGISSIAGLIGGVLLVAMPDFFVHYLIYTFGVIMVVAGIIQILFLSVEGRDIGGMPASWFIMPWLTVATGIAVIIIGPERLSHAATIVTGVALTLYSVNGLLSASAHKVTKHRQTKAAARAAGTETEQTENRLQETGPKFKAMDKEEAGEKGAKETQETEKTPEEGTDKDKKNDDKSTEARPAASPREGDEESPGN